MFQTNVEEKIKTHFMFNNFLSFFLSFFQKSIVYEIMVRNTVGRGRPPMTTSRMSFAYWINKATNTHSEYVILVAFPLQQWLHERASKLCYTYIACFVFISAWLFLLLSASN